MWAGQKAKRAGSPRKCCSSGPVRSGSSRATPALCRRSIGAPAASGTASGCAISNTWTRHADQLVKKQKRPFKRTRLLFREGRRAHLIISKSLWSDTLMFRAMFQERWIMGTMDLTLCNLFHSYRSTASLYWWAVDGQRLKRYHIRALQFRYSPIPVVGTWQGHYTLQNYLLLFFFCFSLMFWSLSHIP